MVAKISANSFYAVERSGSEFRVILGYKVPLGQ